MKIDSAPPLHEDHAPVRPPRPQQDELDGFMSAYLAEGVKPHRERLVDVVRVISTTLAGHNLLNEFSLLASQNRVPVFNVMPEGASALTANATETTTVWLRKDDMTQGARQIGVTPEVEYAPAVLWSLVTARNALSGNAGIDWEELDPVAVQAQFRAQMEAQKEKLSLGPGHDSAKEPVRRNSAELSARLTPAQMEAQKEKRSLSSGHDSVNEAVRRNSAELAARLTGKSTAATPDAATPGQPDALENGRAQPATVEAFRSPTPDFAATDGRRLSTLADPYKPTTEPEANPGKTAGAGRMRGAVRWVVKRFQEIYTRIGSGRERIADQQPKSKSDPNISDKPVDNVIDLPQSKRGSADTRSWTAELYEDIPGARNADEAPVEEKPAEDEQPLIREARKGTHRRTKSGVIKPTHLADQGVEFTVGPDQRGRARDQTPEQPPRNLNS